MRTMSKIKWLWPLLALLVITCRPVEQESPTSGKLHTLASESHAYIVRMQAELFNSLYDKAEIIVAGASTRECLVHLINDSVRLVVTDRPLNDEERRIIAQEKMEIEQVKIATDALGLLVHRLNDLTSLSSAAIQEIIEGKAKNWNRFPKSGLTGEIRFTITDKNSGAYELVKRHFFKSTEELTPAVIMESQEQVLRYISKDPQAIGIVSFACFKDSTLKPLTEGPDAGVRLLAIAGVDSTGRPIEHTLHQYYIYHQTYPMHYPLYVYLNKKSKLAIGFSAFIASAPGQRVITKTGLAPATMPVRFVQQKKEEY